MKKFFVKLGTAIKNLFVSIFSGVKRSPWIVVPFALSIATFCVTLINKPYADIVNAEVGAIDHYALVVNGGLCSTFGFVFCILAIVSALFLCSDNKKVRQASGYITVIFAVVAFMMDMLLSSSVATALGNIKNKLSMNALKAIGFVTKYTDIHKIVCLATAVSAAILTDFAATKEFARKTLVKIKCQPSIIPLVMLVVCACVYLFNLRYISNSNKMNHMGLLGFISTLLSILVLVPMLNAYPRRAKPNVFMIVLTFIMIAGIITSDLIYRQKLINALIIDPSYLQGASGPSMLKAKDMLLTHVILLSITAVLLATIPVYGKLLKKINTSIELEYTDTSAQVELADE